MSKDTDNKDKSSPTSQGSLEQNYDEYYKGGKESKYNKDRFKSAEVAMSEEDTLKKLVLGVDKGNPKIRLFEFGCGDGRFLPVISRISDDLAKHNIELEVIAYDITQVGLQEYGNRIKEKYEDLECAVENEENSPESVSIIGAYKFNNTTIKLVKGNLDTKPQEIADFLGGKVDVTSAMFGPLAHIRPQSLRVEFLKMFKDITVGNVAITVPSDGQFKKHQDAYNMMRDHGILDGEIGDINYKVPDTNIVNQYHVFSEKELKESFAKAGYDNDKVKIFISTVYDTATITKSTTNNYFDFLYAGVLSNILPSGTMSQYSSYLGVVAGVGENLKSPSTSCYASESTNLSQKDSKTQSRDS